VLLRGAGGGPLLLVIVQLRDAGTVDLRDSPFLAPYSGQCWEVLLTTEEPHFCPQPCPPRIELAAPAPVVHFGRPAAVLLKGVRPAL
jgi:hypothetical protein